MKIMIDLETLGTKPNSVILSIGAVAFDENGFYDEFYVNVDLQSSIHYGFDIDASTVYWWLKQDKKAGEVLGEDKEIFGTALGKFINFIKLHESDEIWANSPSFDLVMIKNCFSKLGIDDQWGFWLERDFRTFLSLTNADRVYPAIAHNALEDAKAQAQTLINYWNKA